MAGTALRSRAGRPARIPLHPFEIVTYGAAAATLVFLRSGGLAYGWNTIRHTLTAMGWTLPLLFLGGVALRALVHRAGGTRFRDTLRPLADRSWLVLWVRLVAAFVGFVYTYTWLKVSIPLLRSELYDAELWRLDRWLHGGISPTVFAIELTAGTPLAAGIDLFYSAWLLVVPLWTAYVYASRRGDLRRNFACATSLLWIAGAWIYYLVPAVGPCYWSPDVMAPIRDQLPMAAQAQWTLWQQYRGLLGSRGGMLLVFSPALGVAAMPSLHVGGYVFFALWSRRHARGWYLWWIFASALIFFGSLATAWHYAVDGYLGALLAWVAYRVANRLEPVGEEPAAPELVRGAPGAAAPDVGAGPAGEGLGP